MEYRQKRISMPQLNKGGKFIFGFSVVHTDLTIHLPPQALPENDEMSNIADNWLFHTFCH